MPSLRCPVDELALHQEGEVLRCERGHRYQKSGAIVDLLPETSAPGFGGWRAATYDLTFDLVNVRLLFGATPAHLVQFHHDAARAATDGVLVDVACGTSRWALPELLPARVASYVGVDAAMPMLRLAERRAQRDAPAASALWVHTEAQRLPLADAAADAALSSLGLQFVADHAAALTELRRVLRRGGTLFTVAPSLGRRDRYDRRYRKRARKDFPLEFERWPQQLAAAGFASAQIETVGALVFTRATAA
jgi:SAM-dependent methyltransferase